MLLTTEMLIHIGVEVLLFLALYLCLSMRDRKLVARICELEARTEMLEALMMGGGHPHQSAPSFILRNMAMPRRTSPIIEEEEEVLLEEVEEEREEIKSLVQDELSAEIEGYVEPKKTAESEGGFEPEPAREKEDPHM